MITVAELCSHAFVDAVMTDTGEQLEAEDLVLFAEDTVKTVLLDDTRVIPVARISDGIDGPKWTTLKKKEMKRF